MAWFGKSGSQLDESTDDMYVVPSCTTRGVDLHPDCNGRAFAVFEKLFRWGPDLLSMNELLLTVGESSAAAMVARRHDPRYVVYRISPNYLEALSTEGWPADEACSILRSNKNYIYNHQAQ